MTDTNVMTEFLSQLGTLADEPTTYWDNYETSASSNIPLNPGLYVLTVPQVGPDFKPGKTKADKDGKEFFQYEMDNVKVAFPSEAANKKVRFLKMSVKKSPIRSGSLAGDLVVQSGVNAQPANAQQWLAIMPQLANREFGVEMDLRLYDSEAKKTIYNKSSEFPKNPDGSFKTRFVYQKDVLVQNPEQEAELVRIKKENGAGASTIKVLYAANNLVRILAPGDVRKLRAA